MSLEESRKKKNGGNLVAWLTVLKHKDHGGLGFLTLWLQNDALPLK